MQWSSAAEFFAMGGYAVYVWGAYAMTGGVIAGEVVSLILRGRSLRTRPDEARGR
jgi:heme exporter protein D